MQSVHFSLLLQRAPLEAMLHAAGLSVLAWVLLSESYHVHTRSDEECDRLLHAYHLDGVHQGYIGTLSVRGKSRCRIIRLKAGPAAKPHG